MLGIAAFPRACSSTAFMEDGFFMSNEKARAGRGWDMFERMKG